MKSEKENNFLTISVFFAVVSIVLAIIYYVLRIGFSNPIEPIIKCLSLSFYLIFTPFVVQSFLSKSFIDHSAQAGWLAHAPLTFYGFLFLILAGLIHGFIDFNIFPLFGGIGIISFLVGIVAWSKQGGIKQKIVILVLAGFFAIWAGSILWGGRYLKPLFEENLSLGVGEGTLDTLYLSATSNMIATHGIPSTGLDGLPYLKYHFGSQWIFAQVSNLLEISPLQFYQSGYPIIFVPFLYFCMLSFILILHNRLNPESVSKPIQGNYLFWGIFFGANIGILPLLEQRSLTIFNGRQLYSESHGIALGLLFLLFSIFLTNYKLKAEDFGLNKRNFVLFFVFLPVFSAGLGFVKISFGFILLALAGYFFLRLKLYKNLIYWFILGEIFAAFLLAFFCVSKPMPSGFSPLNFIRANVNDWEAFWFLLYFFWSWLFIGFWMKKLGIRTLQDFHSAFLKNDTILIEVVAVVCVIGVLPGLFIDLRGNAWYFSDIQKWIALSFLLAVMIERPSVLKSNSALSIRNFWQVSLATMFIAFIVVSLTGSLLLNLTQTVSKMVRSNIASRTALRQQTTLVNVNLPPVTDWLNLFSNNQSYLEKDREYSLISSLKELSDMPRSEKQKTLLFIPQSNRLYWDMLQYCSYDPFIAPSITGIPMLDGLPDQSCETDDFGYWAYNLRTEPQKLSLQNSSMLCAQANNLGFNQVITIDSASISKIDVKKIDCP